MMRPFAAVAAVVALAACGSGPSTPKPWSRAEGKEVVVGDANPADARDPAARHAPAGPEPSGPAAGLARPQVQVVAPTVPTDLAPVAERADAAIAAGDITDCPAGTARTEDAGRERRVYCALPDGVRHGPYLGWYGNGQLKEAGPYRGGLREGWWVQWDKAGAPVGEWRYAGGHPVESRKAP